MFRMFHADFQSLSNNLPRRITARPSRSNGLSCSLVYILPPRSVNRSSPRSIFLRSAQGLSLSFSDADSLSPSFVPPLVARNTVLVPLSFLVPQIHRSSSDRLACTVFFPLVVPSKYRISFLLSLSLSLSLLTVYPLLLRFHGNNSLPLSFSPLCRFWLASRTTFFFFFLRRFDHLPSTSVPRPFHRIASFSHRPVESNNSFPFSPNRVPPRPIHGRSNSFLLVSTSVGSPFFHPSLSLPWNQCTPERRRERVVSLAVSVARPLRGPPTAISSTRPRYLSRTSAARSSVANWKAGASLISLRDLPFFLPFSLPLDGVRGKGESKREREKMRSFFRFTASREKKKEGINKEKATFRTRAKIQRRGDEQDNTTQRSTTSR